MRDFVAALVAIGLVVAALSLATTLHFWRRRRQHAHDAERALGHNVVAEIPTDEGLTLFSEAESTFHHGKTTIRKDRIVASRVLINGVPIAEVVSTHHAVPAERRRGAGAAGVFEDRPEGIARDRWDVAIDTMDDTVIVECGAIRERISQELARAVFDAVKRAVEQRNNGSPTTIPPRQRSLGDSRHGP